MKNAKLHTSRPSILSSPPHNSTPLVTPNQQILPPIQDYLSHLNATLSSALQHYINSDTPKRGQKIHAHIIKIGFRLNTNISIKLLILHLKSGCLKNSRQVFDELPQRTLSVYNYMIGGYLKKGKVEESLGLVRRMVFDGESPDGFTFSMILKATLSSTSHNSTPLVPPNQQTFPQIQDYPSHLNATSLSSALQHYINSYTPQHGQKIHTRIIKTGFRPNINISIKLLILHLKSGCLKYSRQVFDELPQQTLSAYNYMINGYLKQGKVEESLGLVRRMVFNGESPDGFTFSMILKVSTSASNVVLLRNLGRVVHAQIVKSDVEPDDVLCTALVDSYVKSGKVGYARRVFDMMLEKNVICSTSMISGYMNQGAVDYAEDIFRKTVAKDVVVFNAMIEGYSKSVETAIKAFEVYVDMQRLNFRPNISTFASVIGACSVLTAFEVGQQVQGQLMKTRFFMDIKMGSALVDMYAKCGRIEDARRVFDHMPEKNVFSWTSMIDGYGKNGNPNEALELFRMMQECCVEPNYVTFLSAVSACGHAGLVAEGREIFESMERDYSMRPKMEHYACMVDLLGRAGSLHQAWEFVMGMPEKPNSDVWAALLSSCNLHGDVEMASIAANELFKMTVDRRPGAYVALSNTLAAAGKWNNVTELREMMKVRGILKDTACSWVRTDTSL